MHAWWGEHHRAAITHGHYQNHLEDMGGKLLGADSRISEYYFTGYVDKTRISESSDGCE